jgi:hypothetical protein
MKYHKVVISIYFGIAMMSLTINKYKNDIYSVYSSHNQRNIADKLDVNKTVIPLQEISMIVKSRILIAAAALVASATVALAQSAPYDGTGDKTLSYGPRAPSAASATANPAQEPVSGGPYYQYDQSPDKTLSYGVRPSR